MNVIIFFESALELIPESLRKHPLIRKEWQKNLKKKNRGILLDGAEHRPLLDSLEEVEKRGRPDIIHHSLINIVYSPLFREGKIQVIVHTRNNLCVKIPSHWRLPVNYNRFCGLFSQLLLKQRVPLTGEPILIVKIQTLRKLLQKFGTSDIYLCDVSTNRTKDLVTISNLAEIPKSPSKIFLIGGFQSGEAELNTFNSQTSIQDMILLSLYDEVKPAWVIAAKLIHWFEFYGL